MCSTGHIFTVSPLWLTHPKLGALVGKAISSNLSLLAQTSEKSHFATFHFSEMAKAQNAPLPKCYRKSDVVILATWFDSGQNVRFHLST
jgi:hypothetical protein